MISIRKSHDRGGANHGWLDTRHTFSFADYHDPDHMGFRALRVINEDIVQPGAGFPPHPHRDMEIVTVVLEGAIAHRDSMGHESVLRPGEVQRMTAGTGVVHSEFNPSRSERLHLYQIWIEPDRRGLAPEYEQKPLPPDRNAFVRLPVTLHASAAIYRALLDAGARVEHALAPGRHAWVQVARGRVTLRSGGPASPPIVDPDALAGCAGEPSPIHDSPQAGLPAEARKQPASSPDRRRQVARGRIALNETELSAGDGAAVSGERTLLMEATEPSEILLFDLA